MAQATPIKAEAAPEEKVVSSLEEIFETSNEPEYETVEGFAPGQKLRICSLSAGDFIDWADAQGKEAKRTAGLRLLAKSLVGPPPQNARLIDNDKIEMAVAMLRKKSHKVTNNVIKAILKLNGLEEPKKQQDDAKND